MTDITPKRAVVTGASSGIGAAAVRALRASGWDVVAVARREEKLQALAEETGAEAIAADVTDDGSVTRLAEQVLAGGGVDALINNAGGAFGLDPVASGSTADWQRMYDVNVLGALRMTQAFLPALRDSGQGSVLLLTSTAAYTAYEGGAGYTAAKAGEQMLARTLRLEEAEHNVRVIEIAPGMVKTEEFSLNRLGDKEAAEKVYDGVENPLTAEDVAGVMAFALNVPHHVNLDQVVVRPLAQAAQHKVIRSSQSGTAQQPGR
ncbi:MULTISPECIES: SDR family oxidoreductase [unclassified Arthrobacter]|uniref:SDR family oxidoreductase n=1 Tax=unclassified Arthrobacter TaxID=235627 RepID=UPI001E542B40|nr:MULTISPECIES: SDR family oxidoreductase [unclassified Arthrobacter]MCC9145649.1 SDR family oxidoreductase [Arthrobacter sp. zg-Y919]MDK1276878.1 SDR family oxidoreductase [Arthrobacter sp. zg.Y919]WIB04188.1 SDR family oxidoreductase [Arthrobacter sp. zg-Y919]